MGYLRNAIVATIIWFGYSRGLYFLWGYIAIYNPTSEWELGTLLPLGEGYYWAFVHIRDTLINICLTFPLAVLLKRSRLQLGWLYVSAAALVVFIWDYRNVFSDPDSFVLFFSSFGAVFGAISVLAFYPLAYLFAQLWRNDRRNLVSDGQW